ncbi:MAG: four helix bundle protein [candidate division WOR-3 bacterium]|nr:four helix bundle protein [candidate division WOR-3 bacterium]
MNRYANDFKELEIYKKSKEIVLKIYNLTNKEKFSKDFALREQIRRAGISIMSNIAEGFDRASKREFVVFLNYAKGSNGEMRAQLDIAQNVQYITDEEYEELEERLIINGKMISSMIRKMKEQIK